MSSAQGFAAHIVGGDIYYDYLGNNQYRFYVSLYRDALSGGAAFDNPLNFSVFRNSDNSRVMDLTFPFTNATPVPVNFSNPCGTAPTNINIQNAIYTGVATLPPIPGGYRVAYQRCCRGPNINNLLDPEDTGITLTIVIPGIANNHYQNNSPRFTNYPPLVLCNQDDFVFDHSATDADGDQLVYSLATPFGGGTSTNPMPVPIPAPNYPPVLWAGGFNANQSLGATASININMVNGQLTAYPTITGRFVVGLQVQEIRDGVVISTSIRDFIFQVFNCNITMQAILPTQIEMGQFAGYCTDNLEIAFENNSFGGTTYQWNFGDPATTADNSTLFEPTYTYTDTGHYVAQLVVNPGLNCTDTAYVDIYLYNELNISFTATDSICFIDNAIDFTTITDAPTSATFDWQFTNGTPVSSTQKNPQDVNFTQEGWHEVTVTTNFAVCEATHTDSIFIIPEPEANFDMPFNYECDGLTVDFINNTTNATFYEWDFGWNNQTSTDFQPSFTFPAGGTYEVQLIAGSNAFCQDTISKTLTVHELMTASFTKSPDQCIVDNSFDFIGQVTGPSIASFSWNFGPNANIQSSSDTSVFNVQFSNAGAQTVIFTGTFNNCIVADTQIAYIYAQPQVEFSVVDGLQCAPWTAQFIDLSTSETPLYYTWDFGDGSATSAESNPSHVYTNPGFFVVTLTIRTDEGCIDTLTISHEDLIHILPTPVAQFSVTPEETDICNSGITFTNESIGATKFYYWLDEYATYFNEPDFVYPYVTSGTHYPYLIVANDEGCSDTAKMRVYIEPFSVFIPNTFTPDKDLVNEVFTPQMYLHPVTWDFKIYNRWGEIIFKSDDPALGWDGTYLGLPVQTGTYLYTLKYTPCGSVYNAEIVKGFVNLLR